MQLNIPHILHLFSDFLIISDSASACNAQLDLFLALCAKLGVPMADEKTLSAANVMIFLGIELDARAIIGRKRGLAGIGTKWLGVKLLNTLRQVSKLTSTNGPIKMQDYPNQSAKRLQEWNRRLCA